MNNIKNAKDGSQKESRIEIFQSTWGMIDLPNKQYAWSFEEQLNQIKDAGFTGILHYHDSTSHSLNLKQLLEEKDLKLGISCTVDTIEEFLEFATFAKNEGAVFVNVMVKDAFVVGNEATSKIRSLYEISRKIGIPLFIETHRGTLTQDLIRTVEYVKSVPEMFLTIDFSHYVLSGEISKPTEQTEAAFDIILQRASSIHARVSNGEQIQIDIGNGKGSEVENFIKWWEKGIQYWLKSAKRGDFFPFVIELGPPPYGMNVPDNLKAIHTGELSDRWKQALVLKRISEDIWLRIKTRINMKIVNYYGRYLIVAVL